MLSFFNNSAKKTSLIIILFSLLICFNVEAKIERRGAIDVGSGKIKLLVADVDTETNHIVKYIFTDGIKVPFSEDLATSDDESFSASVKFQAKEAIAVLIQNANKYDVVKFFGIATEAFRRANNGSELASEIAEELGFPLFIISQDEEAELGFFTAVEITGDNPEHVVVWDIGGGSFQVSWKESNEICSYKASYGKIPIRDLIIDDIQGKPLNPGSTPNPISKEVYDEAIALLLKKLKKPSFSLKEKIRDKTTKVLGIGAIHHGNIALSSGSKIYNLEIVDSLIKSRLGFDDDHFGKEVEAKFWVSDLILVRGVMTYLGIKEIVDVTSFDDFVIQAPGNTAGMIIKSNYWAD